MKNITRSAAVVGKVLDLILGNGFTTPTRKVTEENPYFNPFQN
ncbi:MAG: hypothetical protein PHE50_05235 [Dehalococcoidales bacterium]|nr:hypothetical protein [Dehalococcoidales bacterium]